MKRIPCFLLFALCLVALLANVVQAAPRLHDIRPGYSVTEVRWLSEYLPALRNTPGDTRVYVLQGDQPGGNALVLGGTHGDEIAGILAATWIVESGAMLQGTLFVIPRANNSASTYHAYNRPAYISLESPTGKRDFAYGDRRSNPAHQATPSKYINPTGRSLSGAESRNLNRVYPGKEAGNLTEQIGYAITQLIKDEHIDLALDLHEARPASGMLNKVYTLPKNSKVGAAAVKSLKEETGYVMNLDIWSQNARGVAHVEWGYSTQAAAFTIETPNPAQERKQNNVDIVNDTKYPLWQRFGAQVNMVQRMLQSWSAQNPDKELKWKPVPTLPEIKQVGLGSFF